MIRSGFLPQVQALVILFFALYLFGTNTADAQSFTSCSSAQTYSIGTVDPRFGISSTSLLASLSAAEAVWETPAERNLFTFVAEKGDITVHLIYDSRQAFADAQRAKEMKFEAIKKLIAALQKSHGDILQGTNTELASLSARFAAYVKDMDVFNADVARSNVKGGASAVEFVQFQQRQDALKKIFTELKSEESRLNAKITSLNSLAVSLNQIVEILNVYVQKHNAEVLQRGQFEAGFYRVEGKKRAIGIYEYFDRDQLSRLLAHEMGHALGLAHVITADAIMHELNTGKSLLATPADSAEFARVCP
jgi:predicted HTH domain antitoxin